MSLPDRILNWASNANARVSAVASELTGFQGGEPVPARVLNDVLARLSAWALTLQTKATLIHSSLVWASTTMTVTPVGSFGTRFVADATGAVAASVQFAPAAISTSGGELEITATLAFPHTIGSVTWTLVALPPTGAPSSWTATSTGVGTLDPDDWSLASGTGVVPAGSLFTLGLSATATAAQEVRISNIQLEAA